MEQNAKDEEKEGDVDFFGGGEMIFKKSGNSLKTILKRSENALKKSENALKTLWKHFESDMKTISKQFLYFRAVKPGKRKIMLLPWV